MPHQTTFNGHRISHSDMSHQHLSNCVWFFRIFHDAEDMTLMHFFNTLKERFNGELLPYRPSLHFIKEIQYLREDNMVVYVDEFKSNIVYKGNVIGEIFNSHEAEVAFHEHEAYNKELENLKPEE